MLELSSGHHWQLLAAASEGDCENAKKNSSAVFVSVLTIALVAFSSTAGAKPRTILIMHRAYCSMLLHLVLQADLTPGSHFHCSLPHQVLHPNLEAEAVGTTDFLMRSACRQRQSSVEQDAPRTMGTVFSLFSSPAV